MTNFTLDPFAGGSPRPFPWNAIQRNFSSLPVVNKLEEIFREPKRRLLGLEVNIHRVISFQGANNLDINLRRCRLAINLSNQTRQPHLGC